MTFVLDEAKRCLLCSDAPCRQGCPINTPIPQFIELFKEGEIREAGRMNVLNNPLSIVCSLICPQEHFCEGHCILAKESTPIRIGSIEEYIAEYNLDTLDLESTGEFSGRVAVIGGGPAGIAMSFFLAVRGYQVAIYESRDQIGGVMRYGIPEFRLPKEILTRIRVKLRELGVVIHPNTLVGPVVTVPDLFRDGFDAVFMSTGVWRPNKLNIKGEALPHVHYAIDYLKTPEAYELGRRVVVIGGGNTAMDVARTAIRAGSRDVRLVFHRGEAQLTANPTDYEYTRIDGVKFNFYHDTLELTDDGLIYCDSRPEATEDTRGFLPADSIIIAISQGPQANVVSTEPSIRLDGRGLVMVDEHGRTTMEGVFASGDVVTGARTVVEATSNARHCSNAIHNYVQRLLQPDWEEQLLWPEDSMDVTFSDFYPDTGLDSLLTAELRAKRASAP